MADLTADAALDDVASVGWVVGAGPGSVSLLMAVIAIVLGEDSLHEHE